MEPFVHGPTSASQSTTTDSSSAGGSIPPRKLANQSHVVAAPVHSSNTASSSSATSPLPNTSPIGAFDSHPHAVPPSGKQRSMSVVPPPITHEPVQHIDSGIRAIGPEAIRIPSRLAELPPVYSPV